MGGVPQPVCLHGAEPAQYAALCTTIETLAAVKARCGAFAVKIRSGPALSPVGRVVEATIASPTPAGSGSRSHRLPLPTMAIAPARQSMPPNPSAATWPAPQLEPGKQHGRVVPPPALVTANTDGNNRRSKGLVTATT